MEKEIKRYPFQIISSDILKIVAIVSMLIDHVAAGLIPFQYATKVYPFGLDIDGLTMLYNVMRNIGRLAFPIFCFLLVEGFMYTRSRSKYLRNMLIFAFISEIPFDLCLVDSYNVSFLTLSDIPGKMQDFMADQNVYFTLAIGLIAIWVMDSFWKKVVPGYDVVLYGKLRNIAVITSVITICAACAVAILLGTDYSFHGVLLISIFYLFRRFPILPEAAGYIEMMGLYREQWALPSYILMILYNGKRSMTLKRLKYFFYAFYPVHILIIYIIRCIIY